MRWSRAWTGPWPLAIALLGPAAPPTFAQHPPSPAKLLSACVAAAGGARALRALHSVEYDGEAREGDGGNAAFTLIAAAPDRFYLEFTGAGDTWRAAYDGHSAWVADRDGLRTLTGPPAEQWRLLALSFNSRLVADRQAHLQLEPGPRPEQVELVDPSGVRRRLQFDPATHLLAASGPAAGDGPSLTFADYRPSDGVLEPRALAWSDAGRSFTIEVRRVRHNLLPPSDDFDLPRPAAASLPDPAVLLASLRANQAAIENARHNFTCLLTSTEFSRDAAGRLHPKPVERYQVFYIGERAVLRHVSTAGLALDPAAQRREDARVDKAYAADTHAAAAPHARDSRYSITIADFLNAARFFNLRREVYRGRSVVVFDFEPLPGFHARTFGEAVVQKLSGTAWVDDSARQVARVEARTLGNIKMGGGLLASMHSGATFIAEQEPVADGLWMPVYTEVHLSGRVLLLHGMRLDAIEQFTDYQRYGVSTHIAVQPIIP